MLQRLKVAHKNIATTFGFKNIATTFGFKNIATIFAEGFSKKANSQKPKGSHSI
jgi:hypothetical protein